MHYLLLGLRGTERVGDACDFLNFHRGGYSGWGAGRAEPCAGDCGGVYRGCCEYKDGIVDGTQRLLEEAAYMRDGRRVCEDIQHARR